MSGIVSEKLKERHSRVRAAFVAQGTSFQAWCQMNGLQPQNVQKAMTGQWVGKRASEIVTLVLSETGVSE